MLLNVRMVPIGALVATSALAAACKSSDKVVAPVRVAAMSITAPTTQIGIGQSTTAIAVPMDGNSTPLSGRSITWQSSNTAIATVSPSASGAVGTISGVAGGTAKITAASEGVETAVNILVIPNVSAPTLTASPATSTLRGIGTTQVITTGIYRDTATTVTYAATSSNTAVATVVSNGSAHTVTARGAGEAEIIMTATLTRPGTSAVVLTIASTVSVVP